LKKNILDYSLQELESLVSPKFRAKQIFGRLYKKYATSFEDMNDLPKELRQKLSEEFDVGLPKIVTIQKSSDGTEKYLFELSDGHTIETVLLMMKDEIKEDEKTLKEAQYTICISSQVGCKIGCAFCMTAKGGFVRDLTAGEIVGQVLAVRREKSFDEDKKMNIVYMGMGEPLDNLENVIKSVQIITAKEALDIASRRITISTSGMAPKIKKLGGAGLGINLAISLHAVDNETREKLIPLNKAYDIQSVLDEVRKFPIDSRKKVLFEYLLLNGVNDDIESAKKLAKLINGIDAKVNLINFNDCEGLEFKRTARAKAEAFRDFLLSKGINSAIRASRGQDIDGACGQLRERKN
jgi:23S rRNA (adenine2503-C2)-methyltransferase